MNNNIYMQPDIIGIESSLSNLVAKLAASCLCLITFLNYSAVVAQPELYVHDFGGTLATIDVPTGEVSIIGELGQQVTDIAFAPDGTLYGMNFDRVFTIDMLTAQVFDIGTHGIAGGNALVFGTDGTLYGAGADTTSLFEIDTTTGMGSELGDIGFRSAGDLAFNGGDFFLSSRDDQLIFIDLENGATGTAVGPIGFSGVFGLATADDGTLFGAAGFELFSVDTTSGIGTFVSDYSGQGLDIAGGSSFINEAVIPEPTGLLLLSLGLLATQLRRRRTFAVS